MRWTIEEFDRQPFPFVLELIERWQVDPPAHWVLQAAHGFKRKRKRKEKMTDMELAQIHNVVGTEVATDERALPPWVQEARAQERSRRQAEAKEKE